MVTIFANGSQLIIVDGEQLYDTVLETGSNAQAQRAASAMAVHSVKRVRRTRKRIATYPTGTTYRRIY